MNKSAPRKKFSNISALKFKKKSAVCITAAASKIIVKRRNQERINLVRSQKLSAGIVKKTTSQVKWRKRWEMLLVLRDTKAANSQTGASQSLQGSRKKIPKVRWKHKCFRTKILINLKEQRQSLFCNNFKERNQNCSSRPDWTPCPH